MATIRSALTLAVCTAALVAITTLPSRAAEMITLTQTPCQFLEPESKNHGFASSKKSDCESENKKSAKGRLVNSKTITLKPGAYVFRVTNKNVSYPLGFWLRGDGLLNRAKLPSVSGGGLTTGKSRDYKIDLKPGEYVYSCPLNTTPDYKLVVTEG
jgi:hypothetical protein